MCSGRPQLTSATLKLSSHCRGSGDVEARAASSSERAPRVRNPFPPPPLRSLRRGAGEQLWPRGGKRRSRERAERRHTAALRPTREEQPRRSPPREGGWAAAWGGVSRPPQWLPRSQVDRRPPPPPRLRAVTSATQHQSSRGSSRVCRPTAERRPGDPSPPVLAPRQLPLEK